MKNMKFNPNVLTAVVILALSIIACGLASNPATTPTPTTAGGGVLPSPESNNCEGISGELEMQILVGPAEAVDMEPFAIGNIPFSVLPEGEIYAIQGGGELSYQGEYQASWGTYTVSLDMSAAVSGECKSNNHFEVLNVSVEVNGTQLVEVRADGFQGDYPWSGTHNLNLSFPLEEGATAEGEGWIFILHINK